MGIGDWGLGIGQRKSGCRVGNDISFSAFPLSALLLRE